MKKLSYFILSYIILFSLSCFASGRNFTSKKVSANIAEYFETIKSSPPELRIFLRAMPKGGDLHNHLSGAVYAESYIKWASENGKCLDIKEYSIVNPPCSEKNEKPLISEAVTSDFVYNTLIDALSIRNYKKGNLSGHDKFFSSFLHMGVADKGNEIAMLVEITERAASQNILYLELINSLGAEEARTLGKEIGYDPDFKVMAEKLKKAGIDKIAKEKAKELKSFSKGLYTTLECNNIHSRLPGCDVDVRYILESSRVYSKEEVFAQIMLSFLIAEQEPLAVGINIVDSEDNRVSLRDYSLHMKFVGYFSKIYKDVGISLHAGELTMGMVPPKDLRFHINEAVSVAHAQRIGHGVDIMFEDNPIKLLRKMANEEIVIEINLTSNAIILNVEGSEHPFETYRKFNVPVVLNTDDEGVERIDLTNEYVRAVLTYNLSYEDIKNISFNSLKYSFLDNSMKSSLISKLEIAFFEFEKNNQASLKKQ